MAWNNAAWVLGVAGALGSVASACDDDVTFGEVQVIEEGTATVEVSSCLDAELFSCGGDDTTLLVAHDGAVATMPYQGLFFAHHQTRIALGDRTVPFVLWNGPAMATLELPPAFELVGAGLTPTSSWRRRSTR